jgi:hypothetical protein
MNFAIGGAGFDGQGKGEGRAAIEGAFNPHLAILRQRQVFDDGQT